MNEFAFQYFGTGETYISVSNCDCLENGTILYDDTYLDDNIELI